MIKGDLKTLLSLLDTQKEKRKSEAWILRLMRVLIVDEDVRYFPYNDADGQQVILPKGKITIGVGRNLSDKPISLRVVFLMLEEDISEALTGAYRIFGDTFDTWSEARQIAVTSLIFNMGEGTQKKGFRSFINSIQLMKRGEWSIVARNFAGSMWAKQVDPKNVAGKGRDDRIVKLLRDEIFDPLYLT